jgi:hypothetical protein
MALLYPTAKKKLLDADVDMLADTIKVVLLRSSYTPVSTDEFLTSVPAADRIGTPQALLSRDTTSGVFNAASAVFLAVPTAAACDKILLYKFVTGDADSPLIAVIDLASAITPNGGNITVDWSTGASKIFRLN